MPNVATSVVLANCHWTFRRTIRSYVRLGRLSLRKGREEGEGRDLLRQMTRVALEPLTLVLSPSPRGEATECVSGIKPEMV